MREGEPSRTAWGAAVQRAMHQDEVPLIFEDPLAWRVLGGRDHVDTTLWEGSRLRVFIAVRHRFAEDALAAAVRRGVRQVVVLGAGLDTIAHRNPFPDVRVWEVDHPDTQAWKRSRVAAAGLGGDVTYVPVDFERSSFLAALGDAGFDASSPAFFVWLGVVPYLTRSAVAATLKAIASVPDAEVVLDYANPVAGVPAHERAEQDLLRTRVAGLGEPLQAGWESSDLHAAVRAAGFTEIEDLGRQEIRTRYLGKPPGPGGAGGHVLRARVAGGGVGAVRGREFCRPADEAHAGGTTKLHRPGVSSVGQPTKLTPRQVTDPPALLIGPGGDRSTGVLLLAGSSGRIDEGRARVLAGLGTTVLALRWFGGPGQQPAPYEVPLELFAGGLDRLGREGCDRLVVVGTSFGAEAALLTAAYDDRVAACVAFAPTSVVWAGVDGDRQTSHWTRGGVAVPFVPLDETWRPETDPPSFRGCYLESLAAAPERAAGAAIPVERIGGDLVLVAGGDDLVWPADVFADAIAARRERHGLPTTVVADPEAGHRTVLPGEEVVTAGQVMRRGGTEAADRRLGNRVWPHLLRILA